MKSGSLNLLEPSGPVQACNGIALPLPLPANMQEEGSVVLLDASWVRVTKGLSE
jgi:hypothetical protein